MVPLESTCNVDLIPGLGSSPGEDNGYLLQYPGLENSMDYSPWGQKKKNLQIKTMVYAVQFSSVAQSCPTLCDPMNGSMPGLPVHHQLPEFTQTHIHRVRDAIQPSYPLSSPSSPALNSSQHQSLSQ